MSAPASSRYLAKLSELILALGPDEVQHIHLSLLDAQVVVEGRVPSYEAKCNIEALATQAGVPIQNCLRVVPGAVNVKAPSFTLASTATAVRSS
jgi:hypothetical protein